jgi:serine protease Do
MVRLVIDQLKKEGKVTRGWIGVSIQEMTQELAQKFGLKTSEGILVSDVIKGSPAAKAGITRGDIIIEFDGKRVRDVGTLRNLVAQSKIGSQVKIKLLRVGGEATVTVMIQELPADITELIPSSIQEPEGIRNALSGVSVIDLNATIAKQLGIHRDEKGVVVIRIEPGVAADEAGIRKGDVIQEADRKRVVQVKDFNQIISRLKPDDTVLLFINRGGKKFYVTVSTR